MTHIGEFIPTPAQVLAVADAWDNITREARAAILMLSGCAWVGASGRWADIPAQARLSVVHGFYFFREFMNRVLP